MRHVGGQGGHHHLVELGVGVHGVLHRGDRVGVAQHRRSTSSPVGRSRSSALFMCASASSPPECMSAAQATPWGVAGTSSVNRVAPARARSFRAASSSSDSAVRFATTRTCASVAPCRSIACGLYLLVRREVRVPLAERAERLPEAALGALVVERGVDVRHVQRVAARGELLDLARRRRRPRRASGTPSPFSSSSASSPITTTIRGCTTASSSSTRARHSGAERSVSATGHFTNTVP